MPHAARTTSVHSECYLAQSHLVVLLGLLDGSRLCSFRRALALEFVAQGFNKARRNGAVGCPRLFDESAPLVKLNSTGHVGVKRGHELDDSLRQV